MADLPIYIGLLENSTDRLKAAKQIVEGTPLVMQLGGVYGLFVNASDKGSIEKIFEIKGESKRSLTLVKRTDDIISLVNSSAIKDELKEKLHEMGKNLGLVAHLRFPIEEIHAGKLPEYTYSYFKDPQTGTSYPVVQYLDPSSHVHMSDFISLLKKMGVEHVAVTSFNNHAIGEPEITDRNRAIEFAIEKDLPMILEDPSHKRQDIKGSYAIVLCFGDKVELVRPGAVDARIINAILDNRMALGEDKQRSGKNEHDYNEFVSLLGEYNLVGEKAKQAFILYMMGIEPKKILQQLR